MTRTMPRTMTRIIPGAAGCQGVSGYLSRARAMRARYGVGRVFLATDDAAVVDEFRRDAGFEVLLYIIIIYILYYNCHVCSGGRVPKGRGLLK